MKRTPVEHRVLIHRPLARIALAAMLVCVCVALLAPAAALGAYRQTYGFVNKWAYPTPHPTIDFEPKGISIGGNGNIYVAASDGYVSEYTTQGATVHASLGATATNVFGSNGLGTISNVAVRDGVMWIADYDNGVAKFDTNGQYRGVSCVKAGPSGTSFDQVSGVAIDASGSVYVSDHGSANDLEGFRVSKFTSDGTYVTSFGDTGVVQNNRLWSASAIAIGPDFSVYVADWQNSSVRKYTPTNAARTGYALAATWTSSAYAEPFGLATDAQGNIFVADNGDTQTISKLSSTGAVLANFGGDGTANGKFQDLCSVAVGPDGHVFGSDRTHTFVQEFKPLDLGPSTATAGTVSVKKGKVATFKFRADDDWSATCSVTIKIYKGSSLKATVVVGSVTQGAWHTKTWKASLPKATYTWKVYANDTTGHAQTNVASASLKIK